MNTHEMNETAQEEAEEGLSLQEFTKFLTECEEQPAWRSRADREHDYYDGNQLDSDVMRRAAERGLPPAIEPLIGPTIDSVLGHEAKARTDWRVTGAGNDRSGDDVADALNVKLNESERESHADDACSEAYKSQVITGIGWVEVGRNEDPREYPYYATSIHRNEIWWDWYAKPDMSNARYLIRRKWMDRKQAAVMFPDKAELIKMAAGGWNGIDMGTFFTDGGASTDLSSAWATERGWSIEEMQWRDIHLNRVCLFECWYRVWERATMIKAPDGRVVEYDPSNAMHVQAVAVGVVTVYQAPIGRVRMSWWLGPHRLADVKSPHAHNWFPYVPFWGKREDRTGVPYALAKGMIYLQDEVNARIARMQWGLAATRTTRTEGAVLDDDDNFRDEVARPDADIVLDAEAMRQGGVFKVERDFELNRQQYDRLVDAREGIKRTGGIYNAFMGQEGQALSGVAQAGLVEQSNQAVADINDNFKSSRRQVGELLLSMIIQDIGNRHEVVTIDGQGIKDDRSIALNVMQTDADTGLTYYSNDVQRTRLKVAMSDVASTPSFRTQQLAVMSEAFKSAPPEYQKVMMPYLFELMDVPSKREISSASKEMGDGAPTPEQIQEMIDKAVAESRAKDMIELKQAELEMKRPLIEAQTKKTVAESVNKGVEGQFGAIQTAQTIAAIPQTAPLADMLLKSAGYKDADLPPIVPNAAPVAGAMPASAGQPASLSPEQVQAIQRQSPASSREVLSRRNTNPLTPANPLPGVNAGIEGGQ
ncbi:MAG: hypothetical protein ACKO0Z_23065 [Betaproteobacteria bacterium]